MIWSSPQRLARPHYFYAKKLVTRPDVLLPNAKADALVPDAKSVSIQDDSQARAVAVRVIVVNKADTSTTLVISRANDEKVTHIAWMHYIRLDEKH